MTEERDQNGMNFTKLNRIGLQPILNEIGS